MCKQELDWADRSSTLLSSNLKVFALALCLSLQFSCSVMSNSLPPHGLQHTRLPCPSPIPRAYSNSCPSSQWYHPTISSSGIPFSSCLQSFPASGSFPMCQFFTSGSQSIGVSASASVLPKNIHDWFPLGLTDLISLQSKGLSRVFPLEIPFFLNFDITSTLINPKLYCPLIRNQRCSFIYSLVISTPSSCHISYSTWKKLHYSNIQCPS